MDKQPDAVKGSTLERDSLILLLTWAAGSVDAIGYLGLGHVFTANMTGNIVLLGVALGQGNGFAALRSMVALGGFVLGVAIAALIVERGPQQEEWPIGVTHALVVEWGILWLFALAWHLPGSERTGGIIYVLIALSAVAMGMQSAAVRRLNLPGIATTVVTGTLTSLMSGLVGRWRLVAGLRAPTRGQVPQSEPRVIRKGSTGSSCRLPYLFFTALQPSSAASRSPDRLRS